jgi:vacuolar-type H+-ATPase subunit I/STV1
MKRQNLAYCIIVLALAYSLLVLSSSACKNKSNDNSPQTVPSNPVATVTPPVMTAQQVAQTVKSQASNEQKLQALESLLKMNSRDAHLVFYELLESSSPSDTQLFKQAFVRAGTCNVIVNFNAYLEKLVQPYKEKAEKIIGNANVDSLSRAQKTAMESLERKMKAKLGELLKNSKLASFESDLQKVAEKEIDCLVASLKKAKGDAEMFGPLMGLFALKEKGFEAILHTAET